MPGSHPDRNKLKKLFEKHYFLFFSPSFVTKSVKFGRMEVSIPPIDAKFQDLSFGKGPGVCFLKNIWFLSKTFQFLIGFLNVFVTKSVGKRFHELSLGRNDRLGLGTSKIKFLAKKSKSNKEK